MSEENQASFSGWAKVEVMGHQSHIGFVRTEAYGQAVMFRIHTPELPVREFADHMDRAQQAVKDWVRKEMHLAAHGLSLEDRVKETP